MVAIAKFTWKISDQGIEVFATRDSKRVTLSSLTQSEKFAASQGLARFQAAIENNLFLRLRVEQAYSVHIHG